MIIYIPSKSSNNEIESIVVIFITLQLILSRVIECSGDHVRLLDNLPNSMILTPEIVTSLIILVTEILVIENHQNLSPCRLQFTKPVKVDW
jgi:hypothetical protein